MKRRLSTLWADMPGIVRLGVAIAVLTPVALLFGCAFDSARIDVLQQDESTCAANPKRMPACVFGLVIFGKWNY